MNRTNKQDQEVDMKNVTNASQCCCYSRAIVRVHSVHLMNTEQSQAASDLYRQPVSRIHHRHLLSLLSPKSWYSFYYPAEGRRLSQPRWLVTHSLPVYSLHTQHITPPLKMPNVLHFNANWTQKCQNVNSTTTMKSMIHHAKHTRLHREQFQHFERSLMFTVQTMRVN